MKILLFAYLAYSSALKMEALSSSETSINFCETVWRRIPEDSNFRSYSLENLKSTIEESEYMKYLPWQGLRILKNKVGLYDLHAD
jgi:hypothetical protein